MDKYLKEAVADWNKKEVLPLTISKQWFAMILSGEKTEEYRVIKGFWMSRLLLIKDEECKDFDKYKKTPHRKERGNAYRYRHYQEIVG